MKAATKTRTVRKNRFKKNSRGQKGLWLERIRAWLKLTTLIVILSGTSALFVVGYAAVTRSDYFQTRAIAVSGNQRLTPAAVLAQAGIGEGDNLLALNLRLVRKRLLANSWIKEARITREIPGTIAIQIQEQVPLARVDLGREFLLNAQGQLFKEVKNHSLDFLPVVTGIAYEDISIGQDHLNPAIAMVVKVLTLSRKKRSAISYNEIKRLHLDREMGVSMTLKSNHEIKLGFDGYGAKYERFKRLRTHLERSSRWRAYRTVDLNDPDRIVVQLEKTG